MATDYASWRIQTAGGIKYKVKEGPTFEYNTKKELKATQTVIVRSQDLEAFLLEMIPTPTVMYGIGYILTPAILPGTTSLYVESVSAEPMDLGKPADPFQADPTATGATYAEYYLVRINFGQTSGDAEDSFLEREVTCTEEAMEVEPAKTELSDGHGSFDASTPYTVGDSKEPDKDKAAKYYKKIPVINLSLRYKYVVTPNWPLLLRLSGKVNSIAHALLMGSEPTTVLFKGFTARQEFLWKDRTTQIKPWSFDLQFGIKRIVWGTKVYGWNHYWSANKKKWMWKLVDGKLPFELDNVALLFT